MADGDQTIVLTSETTPQGINRIYNRNVWEKVITANFDADDTTDVTLALPLNGILRHVTIAVPDTTNAITTQLQINDNGNNTVFDTGELAENVTYNYSVDEPLTGIVDFVVGVSGAVGVSLSEIVVTIRGI
jgi:hypothetical protein